MAEPMGAEEPTLFEGLQAQDVPLPEEPPVPDHSASRNGRRNPLWGRRTRATRQTAAPRTRKTRPDIPHKRGMFIRPITNMYTTVGMGVFLRDPVCGKAIVESAEAAAKAWDDLAYDNDAVRRALWMLVQGGQMGALLIAHLPILAAVGMHHVPMVKSMMEVLGKNFADKVEEMVHQGDQFTVRPEDYE